MEVPLSKFDSFIASNKGNWPSNLPYLDNFLSYLQKPNSTSIDDMYRNYLVNNLRQQTTENPAGVWFDSKHNSTYKYTNQQNTYLEGFYVEESESKTAQTYSAFGYRAADASPPSSSTIELCKPEEGANNTVSFPTILNLTVKAAHAYGTSCYPIYDRTNGVYIVRDNPNRASLLSKSNTIYRSAQLTSGVTAVGSFGVSLLITIQYA